MMPSTEGITNSEVHSLDEKLTALSLHRVPRTTISDLPGEILHLITDHVEPSDLANLRLTNKAFCTTATKPFGINYLIDRRFIISRKGLQSLCDLAAHPVFGPRVQSVLLSTYRLSKEAVKIAKAARSSSSSHEDWMRKYQPLRFAETKQITFLKSRQHIALLTRALRNFKQHGRTPTLGIYDDLQNKVLRKGHGFNECWGSLSPDVELDPGQWIPSRSSTLRAITIAKKRSGFPLGNLELDLGSSLQADVKLDEVLYKFMVGEVDNLAYLRQDVDLCFKLGTEQELRLVHIQEPQRGGVRLDFCGRLTGTWRQSREVYGFRNHLVRDANDGLYYYHFFSGSVPYFTPSVFGEVGEVFIPGSGLTPEDMFGPGMLFALLGGPTGMHTFTRFEEIHLETCTLGSDKLIGLLTGHYNYIKKLELVDVRLLMTAEDQDPAGNEHFPFLYAFGDVLKKWVKLESLVIKNLMCDDDDLMSPIRLAKSGLAWHGADQVREGWDGFVADIKKHVDDRREGFEVEWSGSEDDGELEDDSDFDDEDDEDDEDDYADEYEWDDEDEEDEDDEVEDDEDGVD